MTSPRVIELPRRLEPVSPDTFLGGLVLEFTPPTRRSNVVALRLGDAGVPQRHPAPSPPPPAAA
jgi:hypothetical protein